MKYTQTQISGYSVFYKCCMAILAFVMLCPKTAIAATDKNKGLSVICIDAGHGGKDPGCISGDKKTFEKSVTLDIAQRLAAKIKASYPGVKVVMTRNDNTFVTLAGRAETANKAGANLFISIHVNATASSSSANGYSLHVLGQSSHKDRDLYAYNMEICKRENSVMLLEDDYETTYQGFDPTDPESFIFFNLMQNAYLEQSLIFAEDMEKALAKGPIKNSRGICQNPFYVLWKTAMPAVLVEIGFISNSSDLAKMRTESGRDQIAECLCNAFGVFKRRYDGSVSVHDGTSSEESASQPVQDKKSVNAEPKDKTETKTSESAKQTETPAVKPQTSAAVQEASTKTQYGIQVLASARLMSKDDKFFKGHEPEIVKVDRLYKYIVGCSDTPEGAKSRLQQIRKDFPGCFVVKIENGGVSVYR